MAKTIQIKTEIDNKKSLKSIKTMTKELDEMKDSIEDIGDTSSKEFKTLAREIKKAEGDLKDLNKSFEGLDSEAKAGELGKIAGGLGAIGTAAAVVANGNEGIEKLFQTFATGIAITQGVKGAIEAYSGAMKLLKNNVMLTNIATKAMAIGTAIWGTVQAVTTTVIGATSGALKIFRLALISTGIGAIIVGIGLLIANFDYVTDAIGAVGKMIYDFFKPAIDLVIDALQWLGIMESDAAAATRDAAEVKIAAYEDTKAALESLMATTEQATEDSIASIDREIARRKAGGQDVTNLERKRLKEILDRQKVEAQVFVTQKQEFKEYISALKTRGDATEEEADAAKATLKELTDAERAFNVNYKKSKNDLSVFDITQSQKRIKLREKEAEDEKKRRKKSSADRKRQRERDAADEEKAFQDSIKRAMEQANQLREFREIQEDIRIEGISNEYDREVEETNREFFEKMDDLREKGMLTLSLEIELEYQRRAALGELKKEKDDEERELELERIRSDAQAKLDLDTAKKESDAELALQQRELDEADLLSQYENKEISEYEHKLRMEQIDIEFKEAAKERDDAEVQRKIDIAAGYAASVNGMAQGIFEISNNLGKQDEKSKEKRAKRQFQVQKALNISMAVIDGFKAITTSLAMSPIAIGPIPNAAGIASLTFAAATSAINIAKIASGKYKPAGGGGGGGGAAGGGSVPTPAAAPTPSATNLGVQSLSGADVESIGGEAGTLQKTPTIQAYVVESDITTTQNNLSGLQSQSEIG